MAYTLIGHNRYIDDRGRVFAKIASEYKRIETPATKAEDRYIARRLEKGGETCEK